MSRFKVEIHATRPLIGILTAGHRGRTSPDEPFAYQGYLFRHLTAAAERMGCRVCAFEPYGIDWSARRIRCHVFAAHRWLPTMMPFPDVVYNRVPNRRLEALPEVQTALARFRDARVPLFNPCFIDKTRLYESLTADPEVSRYVPATHRLSSDCDIAPDLAQWGSVYLKPRLGSLGHGIIRVEGNGRVARLHYRLGEPVITRSVTMADLPAALRALTHPRDYVVQRGIDMLQYRGRKFDVRCLIQKNGCGQWRLTGMGVRVAGAGGVTTHVPAGGYIASVPEVLHYVFGPKASSVTSNLRAAISDLAPAVERCLGGTYGELSMDLGLDHAGAVWFFEANSKPHKFDEDSIRLLSWNRTIAYAAYLGGFPGLDGCSP